MKYYINSIKPSSGGRPIYPPPPHPSVTAWTPPSDWIDISTVNDNEILLLVSDQSAGYAFAVTTVSGTYSIDWGDDTIEIGRTSGTTYSHEYVLGGGTPCSLGYTTYKIRIYGASSNITSFGVKKSIYGVSGGLQYQQHSYLWANFGTAYITSYANAFFINSTVYCPNLQAVKIISLQNCTSTTYMFGYCYSLQSITLPTSWGSVTTTASMFYNCYPLQSITLPTSWGNVVNTTSMFYNCYSLQYVSPMTSWGSVTTTYQMFYNCNSLQSITLPTTWGNVTNTSQIFYSCRSLQNITLPTSWGSVTNASNMFSSCYSLQSITLPTTWGSINTTASMFNNCYSLIYVSPTTSWGSVTITSNMFNNCASLQSITLPTTWGNVTNTSNMFYYCPSLQYVSPTTSWGSVNTTSNMFNNCYSLQSITLPTSWGSVTNASNMFNSCYSLQYVSPITSWGSVTDPSSMFSSCTSLQSITLPTSWGNVTNTAQMFNGCYSLQTITLPSTSWGNITAIQSTFNNCYSLGSITLPLSYSASAITNASNIFYYTSLRKITNIEYLGSTANNCNFTDLIIGLNTLKQDITMNTRLSSLGIYGLNATTLRVPITGLRLPNQNSGFGGSSPQINISYTNLNKNALELLFDDLPPFTTAKGINITGVSGVDTAISKTSCGTTNGSTTVTISNTSSLSAGMEITGTGISSAVAVTLTDSGDLVTRTAHGLSDGDLVSFATITSTTGIIIYKPYYVINITPNTFQLSLTNGGAVIPLTTDGSGTIIYQTKIVSINNNVSIIINKPASATGSVTLAFTLLQRSKATMKNWTITG